MAVLKCKMCGGDLEISEGVSVCECEYCGTKQTVPSADNEKKMALFGRANRLRFGNEFDKAAGVYESIVAEFPEEAEAYWGLVLCKYGIEYVDDPASGKKIPTCHRSSFESVMDDSNFEQALENADTLARTVYRDEAKQIEELRKEIIEVSSKEEPYDIFICYKETDDNGDRTVDSVIAQDVYTELTEKGYRVFFSRISLEDKLGVEYEPYIFAALNSAKIMLAFGTDYEYYNAVWVKNEWSRFLQLIAKGEKKTLIPCYKGIDAYDMPKEFAKLQAQDMGKVGAIQDLLRGIEKVLPKNGNAAAATVQSASPAAPGVESLLERAFMFLEDGNWNDADAYCDKVLDIDPKCAKAYLGKLMAEQEVRNCDDLSKCKEPFDDSNNFQKALRFGDEQLVNKLRSDIDFINQRNEETRKELIYNNAVNLMSNSSSEEAYKKAANEFESISGWKNASDLATKCFKKAEECRKDVIYNKATKLMNGNEPGDVEKAIPLFQSIPGWKDADELAAKCPELIANLSNDKIYTRAINILEKSANRSVFRSTGQAEIQNVMVTVGHTASTNDELFIKGDFNSIRSPFVGIVRQINVMPGEKAKMGDVLLTFYEDTEDLKTALQLLSSISGWRDSSEKIAECHERLKIAKEGVELGQKTKEEEDRIAEQKAKEAQKKREHEKQSEIKKNKGKVISLSVLQLLIACLAVFEFIYSKALKTAPEKFYDYNYVVVYYVAFGCVILLSAICIFVPLALNKKAKAILEHIPDKLSAAKAINICAIVITIVFPIICSVYSGIYIHKAHDNMKQNIFHIKTTNDFSVLKNYPFAHYLLDEDLDLNEVEIKKISSFKGTFDGQGHKISNVNINDSIIGYSTGHIQNLILNDVNVNGDTCFIKENEGKITNFDVIGVAPAMADGVFNGIVKNNKGIISNCSVDKIQNDFKSFTGFVFSNSGKVLSCNVKNVDITITGDFYGFAYSNSGSIIGCSFSGNAISQSNATGFLKNNTASVERCFCSGSISGYQCVSGFIDDLEAGSVVDCFSKMDITQTTIKYNSIGSGFVGEAHCNKDNIEIKNCYYSGTIRIINGGDSSGSALYGGLIGWLSQDKNDQYVPTITNTFCNATYSVDRVNNKSEWGTIKVNNTYGTNKEHDLSYNQWGYIKFDGDFNVVSSSKFKNKSFIENNLGWDADIWDIQNGSLPTLKPYVETE